MSSLSNLENDWKPIKRAKPNRHRRKKRQAPHKYLEMALVADNFAISAYGEDEMKFHLLTIAHIVSFLFSERLSTNNMLIGAVLPKLRWKEVALLILTTDMNGIYKPLPSLLRSH